MSDMIGNFEHGFIPHDVECLQMGNRIKELEVQLEQANKGYTWASVAFEKSQKKIEELEKRVEITQQVLKNECENETELRTIAKKVLSEFEVEGDSYGVPMIQDIAELLVKKVEELQTQLASMWKPVSVEEMKEIMRPMKPKDSAETWLNVYAKLIINRLEGKK